MYPFLKLISTVVRARYRPPLELEDTGYLRARAGITDIDPFLELNHARQILYMELGRWDFAQRVGFVPLMRSRGWGFTVGGISIRYRRRVGFLQGFTVTTRPLCHDSRWFYLLQEVVRGDQICSSALIKAGVVSKSGLVPAPEVLALLNRQDWGNEMPAWTTAWIEAEGQRPWPSITADR